jgi:hypothetical protein
MEFKGIISKVVERSGTSQSTGKEWKRTGFVFEFKEHDTDPWFDKVYLEPWDENIIAQLKEGAQVKVGFRHATTTYGDRIYNDIRMNSFEVLRKKEAEPEPIKFVEQTEAIQPTPEGDDLPF